MKVSRITKDGDWTFGKGRANYTRNEKAIAQNVVTRLRSFTDDWFINIEHGIPWFALLGQRGTERRILRAIERTVLQTEGVREVTRLEIIRRDGDRGILIDIEYVNVYNNNTALNNLELPV
jgi:hypothetical protein